MQCPYQKTKGFSIEHQRRSHPLVFYKTVVSKTSQVVLFIKLIVFQHADLLKKTMIFSQKGFQTFCHNYSEEHIQSTASKCRPWKMQQMTKTMFIKTGGIWQCQVWENNNQNLRFSLSSMFAFVLVAAPVKTDAPTSEKYGVPSN